MPFLKSTPLQLDNENSKKIMNHLIAQYKQLLDLQDSRFSLIEHEDAMVAVVYKVTTASGKEYVLKICSRQGDYLRESYFLKSFEDKIPVPRIIQLVEPEKDIHGAILMECLPGHLLNIADINEKLAYETGCILAKIHATKTQGHGDLTQPNQLSTDPRIPFTLKFEEGIDECKDHFPSALIDQCRIAFDRQINLLSEADGPCTVHRDFRPGNVMVFNNQIQGVIDWSSGRGGFAEEDFSPIEQGEWSQNHSHKKALLTGYASIRPIPHYLELMPLLRLSKAIGVIGFTVKCGTWNSAHSRLYQWNRRHLEELLKSF
jgi:aminoglycoside phosphotransferase (APT) family kinase protein